MKKIIIGIFCSCMFSLNAWGINIPEEDNVTKVIRLLREVEERVNTNHEEGTIFLGNTSAGKSTLFNYMQSVPLQGRAKGFGKYEIALASEANEKDCSTIGFSSTVSQTTLPVIIGNNFDSPGFQDTRDFQDIVNAYSIYRIVNQTRNLRVLLTTTFEEIDGTKGNHFFNLLDQVGEIFQNNMDTLCQSLCFVVTKANGQQVNKEEYKGLFATMLQEQLGIGLGNESPRIKILRFLSERDDRLSFFRMPDREGLLPGDDRVVIQTMLDATPYQAGFKPKLSLSAESHLAVNELISGIFKEIRKVIDDLSKKYPELYENFIQSHLDKKAFEIRKKLEKITTKLNIISDSPDIFYKSASAVEFVLKKLKHENQRTFREHFERLSFFEQVGLGEKIKEEIENRRLFSILTDFKRDAENFVKVEQRDNNSVVNGFLLGISDLNKLLRENTLSEIELHSLNTLLIDEDLNKPRLNLTLIAPRWKVIGNKTIFLKGRKGLAHDNIRARDGDASSSHGSDGIPGKPGESGGHFYGRGKTFQGLERLTIDTSGGQGGPGQHGGHGHRGANGDLSQRRSSQKVIEEGLSRTEQQAKNFSEEMINGVKMLFTFNKKFRISYFHYWKGTAGGNAGKGGIGGNGGKAGSIIFQGINIVDVIQINQTEDESGVNGESGNFGKGGKTLVKKKIFIDERMFKTNFFIKSNTSIPTKLICIMTSPVRLPISLILSPLFSVVSSGWENRGQLVRDLDEAEEDGTRPLDGDFNTLGLIPVTPKPLIKTQEKQEHNDMYRARYSQSKLTIPL